MIQVSQSIKNFIIKLFEIKPVIITKEVIKEIPIEIEKIIYKDLTEDDENMKIGNVSVPKRIINICYTIRDKYPEEDLYYYRTIKLKDKTITIDVPLRDWISPISSHYKWCNERGLTLENYVKLNKENGNKFTMEQLIDALRFEIYRQYIPTKQYRYDSSLYGENENWEPVIDTWHMKLGDCESSSMQLQCLFLAAGLIGPLEYLNWNTCGQTPLGGHSTITCFNFETNSWRHLESTSTSTNALKLADLPEIHDSSDQLNITDVWFSFCSQMSRAKEMIDLASKLKTIK